MQAAPNDAEAEASEGVDSDNGLCDVSFPIVDPDASDGDDDDGQSAPAGATVQAGKDGAEASSARGVDEDAALRCLRLSVDAHVKGGEVKSFQPMPTKSGDEKEAAMNDAPRGESSNQQRGEWFPAALPLPSWAKNII
ncbi:hypothetical protein ACHAXT_002115 [Thalassiosira profunda]